MRILIALDFSDCSRLACKWAVDHMLRVGAGELICLTVIESHGGNGSGGHDLGQMERSVTETRKLVEAELQKSVGDTRIDPAIGLRYTVSRGRPDVEILRTAETMDVDMIVVGTHGRRGLERLIVGSVAERVLRGATTTVVVVKPRRSEEVPS